MIRICGAMCNNIIQTLLESKIKLDDFIKYINENHTQKTLTLVKTAYYIEQTPEIVKDYPTKARITETKRQMDKKKRRNL